jgi:hypothetical protein
MPQEQNDKMPDKRKPPVLNYQTVEFEEDQKLVAVRAFVSEFEANLAFEALRAEGIHCALANEHTTTLWKGYGGIKLLVHAQDKDMASQFLPPPRGQQPEPCPACKSRRTQEVPWRTWVRVLNVSLLGLPLVFLGARWKCEDCGKTFTPDPQAWDE